jgi:hypothetical protein
MLAAAAGDLVGDDGPLWGQGGALARLAEAAEVGWAAVAAGDAGFGAGRDAVEHRLPRGVMSGYKVDDEAEDVELHDASCVCQFSN